MAIAFRYSQEQALQLAAIAAFVGAVITVMFSVGPSTEASVFPVLRGQITDAADLGGRFRFNVTGEKFRGCQLLSVAFAWRLAGKAVMPTGVSDESGLPVRAEAYIPTGMPFSVGPLFAVVPTAARLAPAPELVVTYYYRCHWLWVTEQDLVAPVTLAPPPPPVATPAAPA